MPELLEPADPRGGSSEVVASGQGLGASKELAVAPPLLAPSHQPLAAPALLVFDGVSKWYGPVIGVNQVTLELRPGVITGLVGANGAGKTTLMRLATGQLRPDLGSVQVCGQDAWSPQAKRHVGYSPDNDTFYEEMRRIDFADERSAFKRVLDRSGSREGERKWHFEL